jgi:3-hydroxypropanoate dehydrogenase
MDKPMRWKFWTREATMRMDDKALQQLFLAARTNRAWLPREVPDSVLKELVDLMKMGPTANNGVPARVTFVRSKAAKERLMPHLSEGNRDKTMKAPACAIIAYDLAFYARPPKGQDPLKAFEGKPEAALTYALRNGSLQGAYFMMAARALGLDVGPMSGFDNAGVDKEFFAGTDVKSNFLCNVGYGDPAALRPRGPRFAFDEMAQII